MSETSSSKEQQNFIRRPYNAAPYVGSPLSDPGLPQFSTSPQSMFIERTQSLDFLGQHDARRDSLDSLQRSPSNFSEIEVILDDGTTQKRAVSLSTLPDRDNEEEQQPSSSSAYYTNHHHHTSSNYHHKDNKFR